MPRKIFKLLDNIIKMGNKGSKSMISIIPDKKSYLSGEMVSGRVYVSLLEEVPADYIWLTLTG